MRVCPHCRLVLTESQTACPRDGAAGEPRELAPVPEALAANFSDCTPYARGDTGTCYRVTQTESGYHGLLKILPLSRSEAADRIRLKRELRKQTALTNDSLVRIIDGGEMGQDLWLFRDLVEGESLASRIARDGALEVGEALAITAQLATALDELHRSGLLHRDVKPGHVMLSGEGNVPLVTLIDAGIAAHLESGSMFDLVGTPAYMSPEQAAGKVVSFRSDLYSLGCVLYEMLAGEPPFSGPDVKQVLNAHENASIPKLTVSLPASVETLLETMLAKEPRRRPFSAQQIRRTLEPYLPDATPPGVSASRTASGNIKAPAAAPAGVEREDSTQEVELEDVVVSDVALLAGTTLELTLADVVAMKTANEAAADTALAAVDLTWEDVAALRNRDDEATERVLLTLQVDDDGSPVLREAADGAGRRATGLDIAPEVLADLVTRGASDGAAARTLQGVAPPLEGEEPVASEPEAPTAPEPAGLDRPSVNFDVESLFEDDAAAGGATGADVTSPPSDEEQRNKLLFTAVGGAMFLLFLWVLVTGQEPEPMAGPVDDGHASVSPVAAEPSPEPAPESQKPPAEPSAAPAEPAEPADEAAQEPSSEADPAAQAPATGEAAAAASEPPSRPAGSERGGEPGGVRKATLKKKPRVDHKAAARRLYQAKRYREAAAAYQRATQKTPRDPGAFAGLGAARLAAGDAKGSIQAYQRAIRLAPRSSGFHAALGRAYARKGDKRRASKAYRQALKLNPKNHAAAAALKAL